MSAVPETDDGRPSAFRIRKDNGQQLLCLAWNADRAQPLGTVVMPPGYERRMHHYAVFAAYLVRHGFNVVRFDMSNHIGESDGEVAAFTMSSMADDIEAVVRHVSDTDGAPVSVVATSLASRAAIRSIARARDTAPVHALAMILPVVDTEFTTTQAIGKNVIDEWRSGVKADATELCRVLSHDVTYRFSEDAIEQDWASADATRRELADLPAAVLAIAAANDSWVDIDHVAATVAGAAGHRDVVVIEAASHEFSLNAPVVRQLMEEVVGWLRARHGEAPGAVEHPSFQDVVDLVNRERAWKTDHYAALLEESSRV